MVFSIMGAAERAVHCRLARPTVVASMPMPSTPAALGRAVAVAPAAEAEGTRGNAVPDSSVMIAMRALATATVLGSLLTGCMALPEAEELVLLDDEREAMPELHAIPYDEAYERVTPPVEDRSEPPAASEPVSRRNPPSGPRFAADAAGPDACWGVVAEGFPAISDDGTTVVAPNANHLQLSYTPGTMGVQWHDVASGRITRSEPIVTADETADETFDEEDARACSRVARRIRRRAHAANMALANEHWRTMEPLPVAFVDPSAPETARTGYLVDVPPGDRTVQLVALHDEHVVRIPGVDVLERHPLPTGEPFAVFGDRATGTVVLVTSACVGDSCTCDPSFTSYVLHWRPETFAAIEQRPCVAAEESAAEEADASEGWTSCEPLELGFDVAPWAFA
jgi:hypothetical protein